MTYTIHSLKAPLAVLRETSSREGRSGRPLQFRISASRSLAGERISNTRLRTGLVSGHACGRPPSRGSSRPIVVRPAEASAALDVGGESEAEPTAGGAPSGDVESAADGGVPPADSDVSMMRIIRFVLPTLGIWIMNPILGLVDTAVVGQASSLELAALGPGVLLCDHSTYVFSFLSIATANLLAISFADKDKEQTEKVLCESLMVALMLGLLCTGVYYAFAGHFISLMTGVDGAALVPAASVYVRIRALGFVAAMVSSVLQAFFLAAKNPTTPMLSVVAAGLFDLVGDLVLCNVFGMGIVGAAIPTVAAQFIACGLLVAATVRKQPERANSPACGWKLKLRLFLPSPAVIVRLMKFAGPVGLVLLTKVAMYVWLGSMASNIGSVGTGAHHIAFSVFMFFVVFGDAVSMAVQSFLPPAIGHPSAQPERLGRRFLLTGAAVGMCNSLLASAILLGAAGLFTSSPLVTATVTTVVPHVAAALFILCCSMATEGIMLAGRRYSYLATTYAANVVLVFLVYHACMALSPLSQLQCVWVGIVTFQAARMVVNLVALASPASVLKSREPLRTLHGA